MIYLAYYNTPNKVCIVKSDKVLSSNLDAAVVEFDATDWNGCDDMVRTMMLRNLKIVGAPISLDKIYCYKGVDYDMGHAYPFEFEFDTLLPVSCESCMEALSRKDADKAGAKSKNAITEKVAKTLAALSSEEKDEMYRSLWSEHVVEDTKAHAKDLDIELTDEQVADIAYRYVYCGHYDCNLDYWSNLENLIYECAE